MNAYQIPEAMVAGYQRDRTIVLRCVLKTDQVVLLAQGIEHNLSHIKGAGAGRQQYG